MARLNLSRKDDRTPAKKRDIWKVLIVDDEISVHQMTKIIMENWQFLGRSIILVNAYSEKEAREVLSRESDLALVFMDVIMERDDSGFRLVDYIRNELGNRFTRIVLRTGQPGSLSIREIVQKYDINDYREKTQLSVDVLYTITSSCIRAYNDLRRMETYNNYIRGFFDSYPALVATMSLGELSTLVLNTIRGLFRLTGDSALVRSLGSLEGDEPELEMTGHLQEKRGKGDSGFSGLSGEVWENIGKTLLNQEDRRVEDSEFFYFRTSSLIKNVLYLQNAEILDEEMRKSLSIFLNNIAPLFKFSSNI